MTLIGNSIPFTKLITFQYDGGEVIATIASLGVGRQFLSWATRAMFAMQQFANQSNLGKIIESTYEAHHCLLWY